MPTSTRFTLPITPLRTALHTPWNWLQLRCCEPTCITVLYFFARLARSRPSLIVCVNGFCSHTALPAQIAVDATSACQKSGRQSITASMSLRAQTSL